MISKKLAIELLNAGLETGADYSEIFFEDSKQYGVVLENGKVNTSTSSIACGVGVRLLKETRCVYGYTDDLSKKGLLSLVNTLAKSFNGKRTLTVNKLEMIRGKNRNPIVDSYLNHERDEKIALLKEGVDAINEMKDPRIIRTIGSFAEHHREVAVFNSKGKWFKRDTEFGRIAFQFVAADQNGFETSFTGPGTQTSINFFNFLASFLASFLALNKYII